MRNINTHNTNLPKEVYFFRGICFWSDSDYEYEALMGMQSMIATVASLTVGLTAGLYASVDQNELNDYTKRCKEVYGSDCDFIIEQAPNYLAYWAAASVTTSMVAIICAVVVYLFLAASNIPRHNDVLLIAIVQWYFPLLILENACLLCGVLLFWPVCYAIGLIKYNINWTQWMITGYIGVVTIVSLVSYAVYIHFWKIIPLIRRTCHEHGYTYRENIANALRSHGSDTEAVTGPTANGQHWPAVRWPTSTDHDVARTSVADLAAFPPVAAPVAASAAAGTPDPACTLPEYVQPGQQKQKQKQQQQPQMADVSAAAGCPTVAPLADLSGSRAERRRLPALPPGT
jgi:hypothetical protein